MPLYRRRRRVDNPFMQVLVDSRPLEAEGSTLGELIDAAHESLRDSGRLVGEVRIDGELIEAGALDAQMNQSVVGETVELATAEPRALAQETLGQVAAVLGEARDLQEQAAGLLRSDQPSDALEQVREAVGVWQQAQASVMHSAQLPGLELAGMTLEGEPAPRVIEQLADQLRELREQLHAGDWLGLADTLEYDLTESAERWTRLIAELQRQIGAGTERAE